MRLILPLAATAAIALGAMPLLARDHGGYSAKDGPGHVGLYERIVAHYGPGGREVKEKFRDGPCKVYRKWETDGDYEETIKCRGPRDRR